MLFQKPSSTDSTQSWVLWSCEQSGSLFSLSVSKSRGSLTTLPPTWHLVAVPGSVSLNETRQAPLFVGGAFFAPRGVDRERVRGGGPGGGAGLWQQRRRQPGPPWRAAKASGFATNTKNLPNFFHLVNMFFIFPGWFLKGIYHYWKYLYFSQQTQVNGVSGKLFDVQPCSKSASTGFH